MLKKILLLVSALLLVGCGAANHAIAGITGYSTLCVCHVQYIQVPYGLSVAYTQDGKVRNC